MKLEEVNGHLFVKAFLRNTLDQPIRFEKMDLVLITEKNQPFARKTFDIFELIEVPAMSSVPWKFLFTEDDRLGVELPANDQWRIAFEMVEEPDNGHRLELEPIWEERLSEQDKKNLEATVMGLRELKKDELNFTGLNMKFIEPNKAAVTVLIRNGYEKALNIETLPLMVVDANEKTICEGAFKLEDFSVNPNTSKPWSFIFNEVHMKNANPDLSRWKVIVKQ
ncbi:SLAP domain-containing protein [Cytobacillus purgationiresistens]|uniref:Accessory Sec system S-layer assembly protein n=1 Tax=Cytobacillus purgationiresistens TaxID=863449 RepID=A0ABU0ACZ1_9BACI|nr:SLAP domain-containing protein [Cytobacillus purgationiresistens]MDQ0269125.1 accessory Sec system S-layer assembly protein [Cytobacillus purgationiresistens]